MLTLLKSCFRKTGFIKNTDNKGGGVLAGLSSPANSETWSSSISFRTKLSRQQKQRGCSSPCAAVLCSAGHCPIKGKKQSRFPLPFSLHGSSDLPVRSDSLLSRNGLFNLPGGECLDLKSTRACSVLAALLSFLQEIFCWWFMCEWLQD